MKSFKQYLREASYSDLLHQFYEKYNYKTVGGVNSIYAPFDIRLFDDWFATYGYIIRTEDREKTYVIDGINYTINYIPECVLWLTHNNHRNELQHIKLEAISHLSMLNFFITEYTKDGSSLKNLNGAFYYNKVKDHRMKNNAKNLFSSSENDKIGDDNFLDITPEEFRKYMSANNFKNYNMTIYDVSAFQSLLLTDFKEKLETDFNNFFEHFLKKD